MKWSKQCIRKHPDTFTIIRIPHIINQEFVDYVHTQTPDIDIVLDEADHTTWYIESNSLDDWYDIIHPNEYIVVNNYSGKYSIYRNAKRLWEQYEEIRN